MWPRYTLRDALSTDGTDTHPNAVHVRDFRAADKILRSCNSHNSRSSDCCSSNFHAFSIWFPCSIQSNSHIARLACDCASFIAIRAMLANLKARSYAIYQRYCAPFRTNVIYYIVLLSRPGTGARTLSMPSIMMVVLNR